MRIGIDASWARAIGTGTGSYTAGLVRALVRHAEHEFVLYFRPGDEGSNPLFPLEGSNITHRVVDGHGQLGRTLLSLSRAAAQDRLDVFHSPGYFLPLWPGPKVVTFHDANMFLQWDKWWRPGMRTSWAALCTQTILSSRIAKAVVTDSRAAGQDIQRVLRLPDKRLSVLYPGIDERFFLPISGVDAMRERYGKYLLFLSVLSPQKNLEGVVRAFAALERPNLRLVLAGREDGRYYQHVIAPLIQELAIEGRVSVPGVVPAEELPALLAGAEAFLFPSFAEGFGLPPLEAMACGAPVVASNVSSLPEVLGEAALLIPPHEVRALTAAIDRVLNDGELRATLVRRGRERAARFRWEQAVERALEIYAAVA